MEVGIIVRAVMVDVAKLLLTMLSAACYRCPVSECNVQRFFRLKIVEVMRL